MRTDNRFLVLSTLGGLLTAASCTLITDVDRTKIPTDAGTPAEGGQGAMGGTGGKAGSGGKGGSAGTAGDGAGGSSGSSMGGESGGGGEAGGTSGSSGTAGATGGSSGASGNGGTSGSSGTAGDAGAGGEAGGGSATCGNGSAESGETCDDGNISACGTCSASCDVARTIPAAADAAFVIGALTFFMDGDTFTLDDGTNPPVIFEFECGPPDCTAGTTGVTSGNHAIPFAAVNFDGLNDETEYRDLVIDAIDDAALAGAILTDAADGGSAPATVTLTNVEVITDTVGNPNFVTSQRCTGGIGCASDADCLSLSCDSTSQTCD